MAETIVPQAGAASRARPEITALADKIAQREAKIGIIGLGYVGMPLALTAAKAGFKVLGFDIDGPRVVQINRGESFLSHITSEVMQAAIGSGRLEATSDFARLSEPDAILICVPTPLTKQREPDLTFVVDTASAIAAEAAARPARRARIRRPIRARPTRC